jgi:hypothetical protein
LAEVIRHLIDCMFRRVLAECRPPPEFTELRVERLDYDRSIALRARFRCADGSSYFVQERVEDRHLRDNPVWRAWDHSTDRRDAHAMLFDSAERLYHRMVEDHMVENTRRAVQRTLINAVNAGVNISSPEINFLHDEIRRLDNHLPVDIPEQPEPLNAVTARQIAFQGRGIQDTLNERMDRALLGIMQEPVMSNTVVEDGLAPPTPNALTVEHIRNVHRMMREAIPVDYPPDYNDRWAFRYRNEYVRQHARMGVMGCDDGFHTKEAKERGEKLLQENLTEAQRQELAKHNFFHVRGGTSGKWYRIHRGRQQNVVELGPDGYPLVGRCFLPGGNLCEGDVMIGQKAELEICEAEAIKISNPFYVFRKDVRGPMAIDLVWPRVKEPEPEKPAPEKPAPVRRDEEHQRVLEAQGHGWRRLRQAVRRAVDWNT